MRHCWNINPNWKQRTGNNANKNSQTETQTQDRLTQPATQYHRGSAAAKLVTSRPIPCILMMGNPMMQVLLVSLMWLFLYFVVCGD